MGQAKICIVTTRNIFNAPCLEKYQRLLKEPYDILYWDRCGTEESCGAETYYRYEGLLKPDASAVQKLVAYLGFLRYAKRILRKASYEALIVFPTQAAWLILPLLKRRYRRRYLLDIRDYAGEHGKTGCLTRSAVRHAGLVTVTSPAYTAFLPDGNYPVSHNLQHIDPSLVAAYRARTRKTDRPIVLSFIGSVRFIEQQQILIDRFKNDPRFHLKFIGIGSELLKEYCEKHDVQNVTLIGRFERSALPSFYLDTDMAINLYGNRTPLLDYALSNKLYSAALMGMPILVSPDTYMETIVKQYGFGLAVDLADHACADRVYDYYRALSPETLYEGCDAFMASVAEDEARYAAALTSFLEETHA